MPENIPAQDIFNQFKTRKRKQWMATGPAVLAIVLIFLAEEGGAESVAGVPIPVLGPFCFIVILGVLVFSFMNWRCPSCGSYLGKKINPRYCSHCGVQLCE